MSARERLVWSLGGQRLERNECQREACLVPGGQRQGNMSNVVLIMFCCTENV